MTRGPMQMSFTSSCGKGGGAGSSQSGSTAVRSEPGPAGASGPLNWLFRRPLSRTSSGSSGHVHAAQLSVSSDTHPDLAGASMLAATAADAAAAGQQQPQQLSDVEAGRSDVSGNKLPALSGRQQSGASFGSAISYILGDGSRGDSGSARRSATTDTPSFSGKLQSKSSSLLHRLTNRSSRQSSLVGPLGTTGLQQQQVKALRISVRIGIASGTLQHGSDLQNCEVTQRAKGEFDQV
jgi:hypothetical protein